MIGSFASRGGGSEAARLFRGEAAALLPPVFQPVARRRLRMLAAAASLVDLGRATGGGNAVRKEDQGGSRPGQYSLLIDAGEIAASPASEWRIYFTWSGGAFDVEIE